MVEPMTAQQCHQWALQMVGPLRQRARQAEELRRLPEETIAEVENRGLLRIMVPEEFGGWGLGLAPFADTTRVLAHGCVSSAWTLSFLMLHNWLISRAPREVSELLFGDRAYARVPCPLAPTGILRPVDDGFELSGSWQWATGIEHADWVIVHAVLEQSQPIETRFCFVPVEEVAVRDVWHTSGMRGTGSNDVVADAVRVPAYLTLPRDQFLGPEPPGALESSNRFLTSAVTPVLALTAATPALGGAEAAVEMFRERTKERVLSYSLGDRSAEQPAAQMRLAEALAIVRAARLVWADAIAKVEAAVESDEPFSDTERGAIRLAASQVVRLSIQAVEMVLEGSGASVHFDDSPLQRIARDLLTLRGHVIFDWDRTTELVGKLELGFEPGPTDML